MKVVFIINNKHNRLAKLVPRIDISCREAGLEQVQFIPTLRKKHAVELATQAVEDGCDYLISAGGDGTLNEVLNGVLQSRVPANAYPAIGLLPYGSANDFARTAGISRSISELIDLMQSGSTKRIDLGKIVIHKAGETRYFINIAGAGLGGEVVRNMEQTSSLFGPGFHYFRNIIRGFLGYAKKEVCCKAASWQWQGELLQMAVANGRFFGNALCVAPDARLTDGKFQVVLFGDLSVWDYLKNLGRLKNGKRITHPQVAYQAASEVILEGPDPCEIEADGEYVGLAPATITVLPRAISFLLPPEVQ